MKKYFLASSLLVLYCSLLLWSCKKDDELAPTIEGLDIDNFDLIQLTNENPDVPVYIAYNDDREIDSVQIAIYREGETEPVARNVIRNFIHSSAGRTRVNTPFPYPDLGGANGIYTIEYKVTDKSGKTSTTSYDVNILNNKTRQLCTFPSVTLPAGKNTVVRLTSTQPVPANEDVFITGNFEAANGGAGDWTGGVSMFKLTRVPGSNQCFYIPLSLDNSSQFKFTLGSWDKEALGNAGQTPPNSTWSGNATQDFTIYNWKGKPVVIQTIPQVLPSEGIRTGRMSVIADVGSTDDNGIKYYLVAKGGNINDKTYPMVRITNGGAATTKVIGAVPKDPNVEWMVVKEVAGSVKQQSNQWGFPLANPVVAKWDGKTNPVNVTIAGFEGSASAPSSLFIVGGATPGGWSNPVPVPSQQFTQTAPGKFELTLALTPGEKYLLLPVNGSWDRKFGGNEKMGGDIITQGPDIPAPDEAGNYKITVDFTTGKYTLVKQ